jgi:hypothetical protein
MECAAYGMRDWLEKTLLNRMEPFTINVETTKVPSIYIIPLLQVSILGLWFYHD